jgi:ribose-phosphate pyrophosphokinase
MSELLNLVNPSDKISCKFEISRFPDGQQSIRIIEDGYNTYYALRNQKTPITIKARLNTFRDLELIICANQALKEIGVKSVNLYVPYFIGARSDRKFLEGSVNYLKKVISPIINAQEFDEVIVMDPHSDVLEACLNNYVKSSNFSLVKFALTDIDNRDNAQGRICLVSPDAGAYKKIFDVAQAFKIENIVTATKVREISTGKILGTEVPNLPVRLNSDGEDFKYVIIDDICDGGRTFIELSKAIKEQKSDAKVYLVVTHGIFSAGFNELNKHFEMIYTTNSYVDASDPEFSVRNDNNLHRLKQMNVF